LGPSLATTDDIPNPNALAIKTILNGVTVQDWNTRDMIFDVPTLIEFLSMDTTLLPGTVILTGTPHGVGMGQKPAPKYLKAGDEIVIEIEQIGKLRNAVVAS
jgi:2-keto-4-pentenoate hydratase/2-oxohepta-3-ene-1,7-dioic acid hydratase in catechol pathway